VPCQRVWQADYGFAIAKDLVNPDPRFAAVADEHVLRHSLEGMVLSRDDGFRYPSSKTLSVPLDSPTLRRTVTWTEYFVVSAFHVKTALGMYRTDLHRTIGRWLIALRAGHEAESLWNLLHADAAALAAKAGLGDDLRSIERSARGGDPSDWEGALLRCRNVIDKLSRHLYRVPGPTYPHITDASGRQPMAVDGENYRNRLIAYLHQKGLNAEDRELADAHLNWFKSYVNQVNRLGSSGKKAVTQRDVANGLMHTYLLLSEIFARSDGEPITTLEGPSARPRAGGS
jgi:hypothetical protein